MRQREERREMNFAKVAQTGSGDTQLEAVQLDGMVLLRIARHCREAVAGEAIGQLYGLDIGSTLEVTSCFAFPSKGGSARNGGKVDSTSSAAAAVVEMANADHEAAAAREEAPYEYQVLHCLREINVDSNTVGWYQSTSLEYFQTRDVVENFLFYQENIKRCVCIVFDPECTATGTAGFKALRLSQKFMELYKDGSVTVEGYATHSYAHSCHFFPVHARSRACVRACVCVCVYACTHPPHLYGCL